MISGAHVMIFTQDEQADRAFLRDVLEIPCIDSGGGWLIFKLPPAELGVHDGENGFHQIYFICDDVEAFVANPSDEAYQRAVDRLLADAHYGEHWGRHWLDLARYADSAGYEFDEKREIWKYRDWVIQALNTDEPYDQFLREQIAGDLLPAATADQKIATGLRTHGVLQLLLAPV